MGISNILPPAIKGPLRRARNLIRYLSVRGSARHCPICGKSSRAFGDFGAERRKDAQCLYCGSLERHRLIWLYFQRRTDLFDGRLKRMLHVAPETCLEPQLKRAIGSGYLTADLLDPGAMVRMDITDIGYPDGTFDVIYCSHVLEHVDDDRRAMREFRRVLKPEGWAILLVPITVEKTFEDPTITDPARRLELFGQDDHVRRYGPDYLDRLRDAGFDVTTTVAADFLSNEEIARMGITHAAGEVYRCS